MIWHAGVKLRDAAELRADLVVDASGPRGKTRQWLAEGGYPEQDVRTVEVDPHIGYTMEIIDVPEEALSLPHARSQSARSDAACATMPLLHCARMTC